MKSILITLSLLLPTLLIAQHQTATLNAGLTSLTYDRGTLDIALLSEIISRKQDEVKNELIQRYVLDKMKGKSFAFTNFAYSSFHALLNLKDKHAIKKELLSQLTIFSLQVGFAETFTKISAEQPSEIFKTLLQRLDINISGFDQAGLFLKLFANDLTTSVDSMPLYSQLVMDMTYEAIMNNDFLKEKGFIKIHPDLIGFYNHYNLYQKYKSNQTYENAYTLIAEALKVLVDYFPLFEKFSNDPRLTIESLMKRTPTSLEQSKVLMEIDQAMNLLDVYDANLKSTDQDIPKSFTDEMTQVLSGMWDFNSRNQTDSLNININDYIFLDQKVSSVVDEAVALGLLGAEQKKQVDEVKLTVFNFLLNQLNVVLEKSGDNLSGLKNTDISRYANLIKIITSLGKLDQVNSYEYIFNTLGQLGINQINRSDLRIIKDLIYFLEAHTLFDNKSNTISVEVESLVLTLLGRYENRVDKNVNLFLGTGLGQTLNINQNTEDPILDQEGNELQNLGFASEKIGVKFKLINNKKRKAQLDKLTTNPLEKYSLQPIISDFYLLTYGSGFLYNIANLTTAGDAFNYSMVGFGAGLAFFNSLDVNLWISFPIVNSANPDNSWFDRQFIGFSFDIKLTEYLTEVAKKRRIQ